MTFKKRGPGCPCECGETPCNERCLWKCSGVTCTPFCNIRIEMPAPDVVNSSDTEPDTGCISDDSDCPNSAPCFACLAFLDGVIEISAGSEVPDCNSFDIVVAIYGNNGFRLPYGGLIPGGAGACWSPSYTDCPYANEYDINDPPDPPCWGSALAISSNGVFGNAAASARVVNNWDGECGEITVEVYYYVILQKCQQTIPIPDPCDPSSDLFSISTKYTHTFKLEYCTCEELHSDFTYIGVANENSCHGITVPDPCNTESARLYIPQECPVKCDCYECNELPFLTISGTEINGTFPLVYGGPGGDDFTGLYGNFFQFDQCHGDPSCTFYARIFNENNVQKGVAFFHLFCHPCEKYSIVMYMYCSPQDNSCISAEYYSDPFSCGESVELQKKDKTSFSPFSCFSYDDHTFSLS